ncbi:MAG: endonuclease V [Thermoplasmata archaeon]
MEFRQIDLEEYFYSLVRQIPRGMVTSYGDLSEALGDKISARACGYMLSVNPHPDVTPCYRVVHSTGDVGNFTHPLGPVEKIRRLNSDGIVIENKKIRDFEKIRFREFVSDYPLKRLQEEQKKLTESISSGDGDLGDGIAGVDVSYIGDVAVGCAVFFRNGQTTKKYSVTKVYFPYIPGYLSYREFPAVSLLLQGFNGTVLLDGNGQLHPRKMGLATFVGVKMGLRTIGIAKSLAGGRVEGSWVYLDNERRGYIMNSKTIVSAGNMVSLHQAVNFTEREFGKKYPWILKVAHDQCTRLAKKISLSILNDQHDKN